MILKKPKLCIIIKHTVSNLHLNLSPSAPSKISSPMNRENEQELSGLKRNYHKRELAAIPGFGWAHSVDSKRDLTIALARDDAPNLEADIIVSRRSGEAVMGHDAAHESTLSFDSFWSRVLASSSKKNVKLDFKDQAAVQPCLARIARDRDNGALDTRALWLNADLVPGPGYGLGVTLLIDADTFIESAQNALPEGVLSLGWKMSPVGSFMGGGYTEARCRAMRSLLERHGLLDKPLVLAVSARVVALNPGPLRSLVHSLPKVELLVWTGTGEPAVTVRFVEHIRHAFVGAMMKSSGQTSSIIDASRVRFDVKLPSGQSSVESLFVESLDKVWAARVQASYSWRRGHQMLLNSTSQRSLNWDGYPAATLFVWIIACTFIFRTRCKRWPLLRSSFRPLPWGCSRSCYETVDHII